MKPNSRLHSENRLTLGAVTAGALLGLAACGSDAGPADPAGLACDESLRGVFAENADTEVLLVQSFQAGDLLQLSDTPTTNAPAASNPVCLVKLNVGPGNPGPADAPSTSPGIGIEIWLPAHENWNRRIHVKGGGGWVGGVHQSTAALAGVANSSSGAAATTAMVEGAVSATTDTGHAIANGSFALNPDGSINTVLWRDFAERGIHEMAVKTKQLAQAYYGEAPRYSYFNGFSTGGRQGHKAAQAHPDDFDGILAGAPAFNWSKFITAELYPQIVFQRDLNGVYPTTEQLNQASNAAIRACDLVGTQHLGYVPDPASCRYDPTRNVALLCAGTAGNGGIIGSSTAPSCLTLPQATAINKIWYGQTVDGSVPDPASDNGWGLQPAAGQKWYGLARGTSLLGLAGTEPFSIAADMVALELMDPTIATPISRGTPFANAKLGAGADRWKELGYADLVQAWDRGVALQPEFAHINTDDPDLSAFRDRGGKMIMYHGLADIVIMPQGSIHYYHRVAGQLGGIPAIQEFYRFYLVPGMAHGFSNGTSNPDANPPLPTNEQLYRALTRWVEQGEAPGTVTATAPATANAPAKSRPLCVYPRQPRYEGGDANQASSYRCS